MNRKLVTLILFITALLSANRTDAQFNIGAGFAFNKYGGDYGKMHPAIQPHVGYLFAAAKIFVDVGFNYSPMTGKETHKFLAYDDEGFAMEAQLTQHVNINNAFIHFGRFIGDPDNNFIFKFYGGASVDYLNIRYSAKVPKGYEIVELQDEKLQGYKVDLGIGGEFKLSEKGYIFADVYASLPATHVNEIAIPNPTVRHLGFAAGYKIYIGNRDNIEFNGPGYRMPFGGMRRF